MSVWNIRQELLAAAQQTHTLITELDAAASSRLVTAAAQKFAGGRRYWLWEALAACPAVQDSDGWRWVGDLIGNSPTLMFFNEGDGEMVFELSSGAAVSLVLGECFMFEFYLTNAELDYLICHNHHDVIVACGSAAPMLTQRLEG
jgi:hypothetical protein